MAFIIFWIVVQFFNFSNCERRFLDLAVLVPPESRDNNCTRDAIQMAVDDVNLSEVITSGKHKNITYTLKAHFVPIHNDISSLIEAQYLLYTNYPVKILTIGPPFKNQDEIAIEFSTAKGNALFSYHEPNELINNYFQMFLTTEPSITSSFLAAKDFLGKFNWTHAGVLYDYSVSRYRKQADHLVEILERSGNKVSVLYHKGMWINFEIFNVKFEFDRLENIGVRIMFALVSVMGARKLFCEVYNRKLRSNIIWLLFEILPEGWASDKFNSVNTFGHAKREVKCSEDELLEASRGYISFSTMGIRKDPKLTISKMTSQMFIQRINQSCNDKVAYAYDVIWLVSLAMNDMAKHYDLNEYNYFYDSNPTLEFSLKLIEYAKKISFEGLTGLLSFNSHLDGLDFFSRIGTISIYTKKNKMTFIGAHDTATRNLELVHDAISLLFENNSIPRDKTNYVQHYVTYRTSVLIILWLCMLFGFMLSASLLIYSFKKLDHFYFGVAFGCAVYYGTVVLFGIDTSLVDLASLAIVRIAFVYVSSIGFTLVHGSIFARIWRNYGNNMQRKSTFRLSVIKRPFFQWLIIIGFLTSVDVAIITTWISISPFTTVFKNSSVIENLSKDNIAIYQAISYTSRYHAHFTIGLYLSKGVLVMFNLFLYLHVRTTDKKLQSNNIGITSCNTIITACIGIASTSLLHKTRNLDAMYAMIGVCILFTTTATLILTFMPILLSVIFQKQVVCSIEETTVKRTTSQNDSCSLERREELTYGTHTKTSDSMKRTTLSSSLKVSSYLKNVNAYDNQ